MGAVPITRVAHCNLNCSSLARSLAFYRDVVGLQPSTHTAPHPQPAGGFPLPEGTRTVQWDAWILHPEGAGTTAPALDLLEWLEPAPLGRPYPTIVHPGLNRVRYAVSALDETFERFVAGGGIAFATPGDYDGERGFAGLDPDGVLLEFVAAAESTTTRPVHIGVNCTDLDASVAWYSGNLGLVPGPRTSPGRVAGEPYGLDTECAWTSVGLHLPGDDAGFGVELRQWHAPASTGAPYPVANHLGIYRLAFMVRDIHAAHATLQANGVPGGEPVALDMGPDVPISGGLWASFFPDPDGACIEFIEELR